MRRQRARLQRIKTGVLKMTNKFIKLDQVKEMTTLCRSTIYREIKQGRFPKQIRLGLNTSVWLEHEVTDYLEERIANR